MRQRSVILPGPVPPAAYTAIIMGASLGGPTALSSGLITQLIEIERRGLHILLVVGHEADAHGTIAAISRYAYVSDPELATRLEVEWGSERILRGTGVTEADVLRIARMLPTPSSRKLSRRIYNRIRCRTP